MGVKIREKTLVINTRTLRVQNISIAAMFKQNTIKFLFEKFTFAIETFPSVQGAVPYYSLSHTVSLPWADPEGRTP